MKDLIETLEEYANGFTNVISPPEEDVKELLKHIYNQEEEIERLNNIIKRLEEFIEKETEIYTLELIEKNTNALSYSLPIKAVYKEIYNVLQELKGSE